ncbi:PA26 p53-induced protein-domain-containing protein [Gongronella butleri]|nr:PA26 p53-induced protein-domain-containing protein [Gongronella butleri]
MDQWHALPEHQGEKATRLEACRLRTALFKGLQVDSLSDRQTSLDKIIQVVKSLVRHLEHDKDVEPELQYYLLTMLRLSYTCPFVDVRHTFQSFLKHSLASGTVPTPQASHLSPSYFIALKDIFSLESTSSANSYIVYPRPSHVSLSPWSHDTADDPVAGSYSSNASLEMLPRGKCTGGRPSDEYVRTMMVRSFIEEGRLSNMYRVMAFFPTFYELFQSTINDVLKSPNAPLHRSWRMYIGIMACAEQQCQYLVSMLKLDFLQHGGDTAWLKGLQHANSKLQRLAPLVKKMARQPWRLTEEDMANLMTGPLTEAWNKTELIQAIVLIASFLSLCNFVLGCGIRPEMDMYGGYLLDSAHQVYGVENELDDLMLQFQAQKRQDDQAFRAASAATGWYDSHISSKSNTDDDESPGPAQSRHNGAKNDQHGPDADFDDEDDDDDDDDELQPSSPTSPDAQHAMQRTTQLISRLKKSKDPVDEQLHEQLSGLHLYTSRSDPSKANASTTASINDSHDTRDAVNKVYEDLYRFVNHDVCVPLEPFERDNPDYDEFMLSEYCWEDQGCDLVNHFLPGTGDLLDDEFNEALSITDWTIFHQAADGQVDTTPLRHAIFYHVLQLLGVIKEDYNYDEMASYLCDDTRRYIEKVCLQPHLLSRQDWSHVGLSLRPEEKCHMNLLIQAARKQALLCYGLSLVSHL